MEESNKKVSIKDIAAMAGVSIATVSHVVNKTRYVSPELVERVEQAMRTTGYIEKVARKEKRLRAGKGSVIMGLFPHLESDMYRDLAREIRLSVAEKGYSFYIAITDNDIRREQELIEGVLMDKRVAGLMMVPATDKADDFKRLIHASLPTVCLECEIRGGDFDAALFEDRASMRSGTSYLIESGHTNLMYIRELACGSSREEKTAGFMEALQNKGLSDPSSSSTDILEIDLTKGETWCVIQIQRAIRRRLPTAVIASGSRLTRYVLKAIRNAGIRSPEDLSIIGYGDSMWTDMMEPPLTTFQRNSGDLALAAVEMLMEQIEHGKSGGERRYVPVSLTKRKSVKMLENGPFGEKAVSVDQITLSEEERQKIRNGKYRAAIVFHYTGTAWAELHERGIRDALEQYNIDIISVTDAHFDPKLQNMQLQSLLLQNPDGVIAVPADDRETSEEYLRLSEHSKLVFLGSIPENIGPNNYVSYVSVNEWENGTNAARLIGEYYREEKQVNIGMLIHGAVFYGTRARDQAAENTLREEYPNINIVTIRNFSRIENTQQVAQDMLTLHPEITALYVSWDQPALRAVKVLKEIHREDIAIFTTDLDVQIAKLMKEGIVRGMTTQRPYEQGRAAGLVLAKSLVSDKLPKYVGVQPYVLVPEELPRAWKEIFHTEIPEELK